MVCLTTLLRLLSVTVITGFAAWNNHNFPTVTNIKFLKKSKNIKKSIIFIFNITLSVVMTLIVKDILSFKIYIDKF